MKKIYYVLIVCLLLSGMTSCVSTGKTTDIPMHPNKINEEGNYNGKRVL